MIQLPLYLLIPLFSIIWVMKLTDNDNIFDFVAIWIDRKIKSDKIKKALYTCSACVAGQLAFWSGLFMLGIEVAFGGFRLELLYNWFSLVTLCIFLAFAIETILVYFRDN